VRTESEPLSATTVTASGDITSNGETVYHRGNVVGTVSQSGGTPTGAVVERDENANGEYVKFADGTLICWATEGVNRTTPSTFGVVYFSSDAVLTFPEPFVSTPFVAPFVDESEPLAWANLVVRSSSDVRLAGGTNDD